MAEVTAESRTLRRPPRREPEREEEEEALPPICVLSLSSSISASLQDVLQVPHGLLLVAQLDQELGVCQLVREEGSQERLVVLHPLGILQQLRPLDRSWAPEVVRVCAVIRPQQRDPAGLRVYVLDLVPRQHVAEVRCLRVRPELPQGVPDSQDRRVVVGGAVVQDDAQVRLP
eukprot:746072-Hanusia_phi.AAC.2